MVSEVSDERPLIARKREHMLVPSPRLMQRIELSFTNPNPIANEMYWKTVLSIEAEGPSTQQAKQGKRERERHQREKNREKQNNNKQSTEKETLNSCRNWLR